MEITFVITLVLLFLSGYFSASETSLFSIGREQISALSKGDSKDVAIYTLLQRGEDTLIVILLANLVVNLFIISTLSTLLTSLLNPSLFFKMIYSTVILLMFGEVIPKNIALGFTMKIARGSAPILLFLMKVLEPLISLFKKVNRGLIRFNYRYILKKPSPFVTSEEYKSALQTSVDSGALSDTSAQFLTHFLHFTELPLLQAAVHRSEVAEFTPDVFIPTDKIALVKNSENEIVSMVHREQQEEPLWYPSTGSVGDFLSFLRENRRGAALLLDEYGSYYGVATIETIFDLWKKQHNDEVFTFDSIIIDGGGSVVEYRHLLPPIMVEKFPDIKTISGLVTSWFGEIPPTGAVLSVESCIFHVLLADGRKICTLKLEKRTGNA